MTVPDTPGPVRPERRLYPRHIPKAGTACECRRGVLGLGNNVALALLNLSRAGACLTLREPLSTGDEVELKLTPPGGAGHVVRVVASVIWVGAGPDGHLRAGVRFREVIGHGDVQDLARIANR
jgi:hypothetical protein